MRLSRTSSLFDPAVMARARKKLLGSDGEMLSRSQPLPPEPIESPEIDPTADGVITRDTQPTEYIPPPASVIYDNKARPVSAEGGFSNLSRNQALLDAQEAYKPQGSKWDWLKAGGIGFLRGGLPGVGAAELQHSMDPNEFARASMDRDIARTKEAVNTDLLNRRADSQILNDQSDSAYRQAQISELQRKPQVDAAAQREQERDNIRQVYNAQPTFDTKKNPQHAAMAARAAELGLVLPDRDEKDNWQLEKINGEIKRVNKTTGVVIPTGEVNRADVPVVEDGLTVTPGEALNARTGKANLAASLNRQGAQFGYEAQGQEALATQAEADASNAATAISSMQADLAKLPRFVSVDPATGEPAPPGTEGAVLRANPDIIAQRQAISDKQTEYKELSRHARELRAGASVNRSKAAGLGEGKGGQSGGQAKMGMSRKLFIQQNKFATAGKTQQEIDQMISGGGYTPLP